MQEGPASGRERIRVNEKGRGRSNRKIARMKGRDLRKGRETCAMLRQRVREKGRVESKREKGGEGRVSWARMRRQERVEKGSRWHG